MYDCGTIYLLGPHGRLTSKDKRFPGRVAPLGSVHLLGRVFINHLPAFVWAAPVIALPDPAGVAAVKVPGVIVAEDNFEVFINKLPTWWFNTEVLPWLLVYTNSKFSF